MSPIGLVAPPPGWRMSGTSAFRAGGLKSEPTAPFVSVARGEARLRRPYRPGRSVEGLKIVIERLRPRRHVRIGDRQAQLVVRPCLLKPDELQTAVGVEIDQIAVRRRVRRAGKDADTAVVIAFNSKELLF